LRRLGYQSHGLWLWTRLWGEESPEQLGAASHSMRTSIDRFLMMCWIRSSNEDPARYAHIPLVDHS